MESIDFNELKSIIKENREKKVMLTFHSIGDSDSVSSAFTLMRYFRHATIAMPDVITYNSRKILEKLGFKQSLVTTDFVDDADMVILLDVNNFEDCGKFEENLRNFKNKILIIDHHNPNKISAGNVIAFNDESYNSATSIVYDVIKALGVNVDKRLANLIATGIISDSAEFRNAFPKTFIQIGELLKIAQIDYQSILLEIQHFADPKTRKNFVADLFNARVVIAGKLLFIYGKAKNHANKIADDGIKIGADATLFYTIKEGEISFSARLRPPLDRLYKINLGKLMRVLAPKINGHGGGHPCAAGAYGSGGDPEELIELFINELNARTRAKA